MNEQIVSTSALIYDPVRRQVLLHLRDGNTDACPHMWCLFGGKSDPGESPMAAMLRELHEELDVELGPSDLVPLREITVPGTERVRHVFLAARYIAPSEITLREGAGFGWFSFVDALALPLTDGTRDELDYFTQTRNASAHMPQERT